MFKNNFRLITVLIGVPLLLVCCCVLATVLMVSIIWRADSATSESLFKDNRPYLESIASLAKTGQLQKGECTNFYEVPSQLSKSLSSNCINVYKIRNGLVVELYLKGSGKPVVYLQNPGDLTTVCKTPNRSINKQLAANWFLCNEDLL